MKSFLVIVISIISFFGLKAQEIPVFFDSDGLFVAGTLALPENGVAPFPIAILVHGSGPSNRDQTISLNDGNSACLYPDLFNQTISNFKDISDHLSANNIAVLRYDKRTFTHGQTLVEKDVLVSDFIIDIESTIEFCKTLPEIDKDQIFLLGHSQGSGLIPIAAANAGNIKGLISLAGPVTPIDSLLPEQLRFLYTECANDPASGESVANQFYEQFQEIRNGTFPLDQQISVFFPGVVNAVPQGYASFWKDWIEITDAVITNYQSSGTKTLVIQGEDDFNVPYTDAERFSSVDNAEIKVYPGINHFLTPSDESTVSIEILEDITTWITGCVISNTAQENDKLFKFRISSSPSRLTIDFDEVCQNCTAQIYDLSGRMLISEEFSAQSHTFENLNTTGLSIVSIEKNGVSSSQITS